MAGLNFDDRYEFDPRSYSESKPGGLLEMLQRAMQEQALQERGTGYTPQPSASSAYSSHAPGGAGLLGKWLALQAAQKQPASFGEDGGRMPSAPPDPNFRQLVRVSPALHPRDRTGVSDRPSYSAFEIPENPL